MFSFTSFLERSAKLTANGMPLTPVAAASTDQNKTTEFL